MPDIFDQIAPEKTDIFDVVAAGDLRPEENLPPSSEQELSFRRGEPEQPSFFGTLFKEDKSKLRARASNAMAYSEMFNIPPSLAYEYHDEISDQLGGEHLDTTELVGGLLSFPIAAGLATHPMGVILGIGAFEAIGEAESAAISFAKNEKYQVFQKKGLKDLLPEDASRITTDVVDVLDFAAKAIAAKSVFKRTPQLVEKITKQIVEEHNLPRSIFIDPMELRAELQRGGVIGAEEMDIVKGLGLKGSEYRQAIKDGLHIEIPAERITIIRDRPWFAKVKELFKLDPTQQRVVKKDGSVTYRFGAGEAKEAPESVSEGKAIGSTPESEKAAPEPIMEGAKEDLAEARLPEKSLLEEAKKYKSAEEFMEAQPVFYHGSGTKIENYQKGGETTTLGGLAKHGYFFGDKKTATRYANDFHPKNPVVNEAILNIKKPLVLSAIEFERLQELVGKIDRGETLTELQDIGREMFFNEHGLGDYVQHPIDAIKKAGYDAIQKKAGRGGAEAETMVFDPAQIKTKSQLTDIWNEAHKGKKVAEEQPPLPTEEPVSEYEIAELNKVDEQITAQVSRQAEINVYQRLEKENAKEEALVKKYAKDAVESSTVFQMVNDIKSRGGLNHDLLKKLYPSQTAELVKRYPGIASKNGKVVFDRFADEMGFDKYDDLFNMLMDAPPKAEAIQSEINAFYDRYYDEAIGRSNEDILQMIYDEENRLLREATKKYKIKPAKGLKKFIRETTGQVKVKEIIEVKPGEILSYAMKEAQKAARTAYKAGNREALAKAKAQYREALEKKYAAVQAREHIKKMVYDLKKIDVEKLAPYQSEVVKSLLSGLDLTRPMKKTILKLSKTREYLENNPEAEVPDYVMERLARLDQKNLHDLTLDELESVHDAVMHQVHLSKLKNKIKVARKLREQKEVLADSIGEMKPLEKVEEAIISSQQGGARKPIGQLLKDTFGIRHDHYDLIIESLAGPNSTMDKVLFRDIKDGIIKQLKYRQDVYAKFQAGVEKIGIKDLSVFLSEEVPTGKFKFTRNERMALYKHSQNPDNLKSILEGGFGFRSSKEPNKVHTISEEELDSIIESLTTEERAFADLWDAIAEEQYTALNKVFVEKNGYNLPKEEFYYPKNVMPRARGKDFESEEALEKFKGKWTRVGIDKGMLEKRKRVELPIYLNGFTFDVNRSIMKSAAYVGLELPLSNASKLLYDNDFRRELDDRYGHQTWIEIEKGLRDIAGDWQGYTTVEEIAMRIKNNLTTAILGLNPFVMAKQVLSLPVYMSYVKPEYLSQGVIDYLSNAEEVMARHKLYSPEFLERMEGGYSRDVADIFKGQAEKRLYGGEKAFREKVMGGIQLFDKWAVAPGMQGAVLQVLDEFKAGKLSDKVSSALDITDEDIANLTPEDKMRLAYRYADFATERTQPMFSPEHRSSLSRGSAFEKLATMFGSFTNQALNLVRRSYREGERTGDYGPLATSLFTIFVLNTLGVMAIDGIRDRIYQRESGSLPGRILNSWAGYMFFLRDLSTSVISKIERGTFMGYDVSLPISRVPELMANVIANGVALLDENTPKGKRDKAAERFVDDALALALMLNGIPYETPKKLVGAAIREVEGK